MDEDLFGGFEEKPKGAISSEAKRGASPAAGASKKARGTPDAVSKLTPTQPGALAPAAPGQAPAADAPAAGAGGLGGASSKAITHDVAFPPGDYEIDPTIFTLDVPARKPAREWPFELDPFQKAAQASRAAAAAAKARCRGASLWNLVGCVLLLVRLCIRATRTAAAASIRPPATRVYARATD
jgi:hypothetical protein